MMTTMDDRDILNRIWWAVCVFGVTNIVLLVLILNEVTE